MFEENKDEVDNSAETTTQDDVLDNENSDASNSEDEVAKTTEGSKQPSGETPKQDEPASSDNTNESLVSKVLKAVKKVAKKKK